MSAPPNAPAAELKGISKRYGSVLALQDVSIRFERARIHAVLGENGAGKSTLMNLLYGLSAPDTGEIRVQGRPVRMRSAADARRLGLAMVHQHFTLVPTLSAVENWALAAGGRWVRRSRLGVELGRRARELGFEIHPDRPVERCSVGERQRIEILKALSSEPQVLILDEPTAVLTPAEVDELLGLLRRLRERGTAIVLVTHKLDEVDAIADEVSVLRHGRLAWSGAHSRTEADRLQRLASIMVGAAQVRLPDGQNRPASRAAARSQAEVPVLELRDATLQDAEGRAELDGVDLRLWAGEIVGVAGVEGNGQEPLCQALAGLRPLARGRVQYRGGGWLTGRKAARELRLRAGHVPADRQKDGVALALSIADNLILRAARKPPLRLGPLLLRGPARALAADLAQRLDIRMSRPDAAAATLSGGNQQKIVLARELDASPGYLVAAHPTRGLDVGATESVWRELTRLAHEGMPIVLVSTDLDEILALSHRVLVLRRGNLLEAAPGTGRAELGALMLGGRHG
jgi:general nucleoside transport system ATP-binding protein